MYYVITNEFKLEKFATLTDFIHEFGEKVPTSKGIGPRYEFENGKLYHWISGRRVVNLSVGYFDEEEQNKFLFDNAAENERVLFVSESKQNLIYELIEHYQNQDDDVVEICKSLISRLKAED